LKIHTVQKGDTLWKISKMHGISLESLIAANPQITNPDKIDVGMPINVPGMGSAPAAPIMQAPAPTTPVDAMDDLADGFAPAPMAAPTPAAIPMPAPTPAAEMGYPSAAKWDGLWKYVVKNGDTMFKIAKQVGVTLEQLKAANPQVANPESIFPNQVLNIPAAGIKNKSVSPGKSLKEQMTAPIGMQPMDKEQLLQPKEMAPMAEFTKPAAFVPPAPLAPIPAPLAPIPAPLAPLAGGGGIDINANLQFAPNFEFNPHTHVDVSPKTNLNISPQWQIASPNAQLGQSYQQPMGHMMMPQAMPVAPVAPQHHKQHQQQAMPMPSVVSPAASAPLMPNAVSPMAQAAPTQFPMMMYIPVSVKKRKKKCKRKQHKCGCKSKHQQHAQQQMMMLMQQQQLMQQLLPGLAQTQAAKQAKTFYRDGDDE